ncbi:Cellulose biosynthesis protein catalytic subunit A [Salmonella enterica subsp. enterica]|nr:Cellulose biosynthesis protein catalytic subunit A [Salmonella enterica subsp. enterica]
MDVTINGWIPYRNGCAQKTTHLEKEKELGHLSNGARRFILGVIVTFSLILALICITQPFNPLSQFIFLLLLWGVALLVRRMPGRFSALMLIVLSLTVSCRYIWWRYTSTLNWDDPVSLVCGLILLFAETYAWIVLVLGYFQVVWPLNRQPVPLPKKCRSGRRWIFLYRPITKTLTWSKIPFTLRLALTGRRTS